MAKGTKFLLFLGVIVALSWGVYECKYAYSYYTDLNDRPWAYSRDENAKLLVGTWQGEFRDPDGVAKTIRLNIVEPVTDDERARKAGRRSRRRSALGSRTDKRRFDGLATVSSHHGREAYKLHGHVQTEDGHQLDIIHFQVDDELQSLRKNFAIQSALEGGQWQADQLTLTFAFTYTTATGSHSSDSADPHYDKKVTVQLSRAKS